MGTVAFSLSDLESLDLGSIKTDIDAGLAAAIEVAGFVQKYGFFLPSSITAPVGELVSLLNMIKSVVDKA